MTTFKIIGGKEWQIASHHFLKKKAKEHRDILQKNGFNARVVKTNEPRPYKVYRRSERSLRAGS